MGVVDDSNKPTRNPDRRSGLCESYNEQFWCQSDISAMSFTFTCLIRLWIFINVSNLASTWQNLYLERNVTFLCHVAKKRYVIGPYGLKLSERALHKEHFAANPRSLSSLVQTLWLNMWFHTFLVPLTLTLGKCCPMFCSLKTPSGVISCYNLGMIQW